MEKFKTGARLKSFRYATTGLIYLFKTQPNLWIHTCLAVVAIAMGFLFGISPVEWCFVLIAIGIVLLAEAFNTSIEVLTDMVSPQYSEKAKIVKDVSAAGVLLSALTSLAIGSIVFLPKVWGRIELLF